MLVIITALVGGPQDPDIPPLLLLIVVITGLFSFGLALFLAIATVYFRDIVHLWGILAQVWMYRLPGVVVPAHGVGGRPGASV